MGDELKDIVCKGCGSVDFDLDDSGEYATCRRCGRTIQLVQKSIVVHKTDNTELIKAKLSEIENCIDSTEVEKMNRLVKEVLALDPDEPYALWSKYLYEKYVADYYGYKDKYGNAGADVKSNIIQNNLNYAQHALKNADEELAAIISAEIEDQEKLITSLEQQGIVDRQKEASNAKTMIIVKIIGAVIVVLVVMKFFGLI